jgi:hypothetical protein
MGLGTVDMGGYYMTRNNNKSPLRSVIATIILAASMLVGSGEAMAQGRLQTNNKRPGTSQKIVCKYKEPTFTTKFLPAYPAEPCERFNDGKFRLSPQLQILCICERELDELAGGKCPLEDQCDDPYQKQGYVDLRNDKMAEFDTAEKCMQEFERVYGGDAKCIASTEVTEAPATSNSDMPSKKTLGELCALSRNRNPQPCKKQDQPRPRKPPNKDTADCFPSPLFPGTYLCCENPDNPATCVDQVS